MPKRLLSFLTICLIAATAAQAQPGGGRGGRGGGPTRGPARAAKPFSEPDLIGVIQAIDTGAGRVTISYEPSEALNWPAGTQPFPVAKTALLKDLTVGEKVRFRLESQQIAVIQPFEPPP
jgi:Cu/Ag efflux protein CusF